MSAIVELGRTELECGTRSCFDMVMASHAAPMFISKRTRASAVAGFHRSPPVLRQRLDRLELQSRDIFRSPQRGSADCRCR